MVRIKRKLSIFLLTTFIIAGAFHNSSAQNEKADGSEVIIQGFNWLSWGLYDYNGTYWYDFVAESAQDLGESGIDAVWLPPPSRPNDLAAQGYLPSELNNLDSYYGTRTDLEELITALNNNGVKAIADIVINHRVGTTDWADFTNPTWGCEAVCVEDEWDGACGNNDTGAGYDAARDIDHTQEFVRNDIKAWMTMLKDEVGFDGWRYDYVKGFSPGYVGEYNNHTQPWFVVGEVWEDYNTIVNWLNNTGDDSKAFAFGCKGTMHDAFNSSGYNLSLLNAYGNMPGIAGTHPTRAVTFIDNHDTGSTQNHWPFPNDRVEQAYAYILTHPPTPCVFWDHFYEWDGLHEPIKNLIQIRKANGINNNSTLNILVSDWNLYAATVDDQVAVKIGTADWSPSGSDWTLATSGTDYAVWTKSVPGIPTVDISPAGGTYTDPQEISITASDDADPTPTIYYTTDGSTPTTSSQNGDGSVSFTLSESATVKAFAEDADGNASDIVSVSYTIGAQPSGITIYFRNTDWGSPYIHYWNIEPTGTMSNSDWPGNAMTAGANNWHYYDFPDATLVNMVLNDGSGDGTLGVTQTGDLSATQDAWYDWASVSDHANNPDEGWLGIPSAQSLDVSGTFEVGQTLTGSYTFNHPDGTSEGNSTITWYRADDANGTNEEVITSKGTDTYTLSSADQNKYIAFGVTPEDIEFVYGTESKTNYQGPVQQAGNIKNYGNTFALYPNPADETIIIQATEIINTVSLKDITGKEVYRNEISSVNAQISVNSLQAGIYFISCNYQDGSSYTQKLLIK